MTSKLVWCVDRECGRVRLRSEWTTERSESELEKLHGMRPTAITALREAPHECGLSFCERAPPRAA